MAEAKPQMGPGGSPESAITGSGEVSIPSRRPPASMAGLATAERPAAPPVVGTAHAAPSLPISAGVTEGISAWQNNKRFTALWSINQNRNSWVGVDGIGWKKLANNSDSAIVSLTMLCSHAREKGSVVNYREEADGMIYEIYVW